MKIGLGTVQFGMRYGISNQEGQTLPAEVSRILAAAQRFGVSIIDTAALYGSSEEVLGATLPDSNEFRLVTKTIRIDADRITAADVLRVEQGFTDSLAKLRRQSVYGLMLHNADDLLADGGEQLAELLEGLKRSGRVTKVGVSVYTGRQIDEILNRFDVDLVQLPINVLDQRLLKGGQLDRLKSRGVEVHARSAFLQGVLLMDPDTLPAYFSPARERLLEYHGFIREQGLSPVRAALGFLAARSEIDVIVCGVVNCRQFTELCQSAEPLANLDFSRFALDAAALLDPSQWG